MFDNISKCEYEIKFDNLKDRINNYYKNIKEVQNYKTLGYTPKVQAYKGITL